MKNFVFLFFVLLLSNSSFAKNCVNPSHNKFSNLETGNIEEKVPDKYLPYIFAKPQDLEWFQDAKYGVFIHWNPSSLAEAVISFGRNAPRPGPCMTDPNTGVPKDEYDNLYKKFNPQKFNADKWMRTIKAGGAKYVIFTTKHCDGFCMFDANNTDYKITNSPYGKDICKEIADACHKYDLKLFWYYSLPSWYHPDFYSENHDRYRDYVYEHLAQLLTDYGKIDGVWFDMVCTTSKDWDTPRMLKMMRTLQPGLLVNDRWGRNMPGVSLRGDYATPEQEIGHFNIDRPWESCVTMERAWSWVGGEMTKTSETCLRILIQSVGAGGNLALNIGPKPNGEIFAPEKLNLKKIGNWLNEYGEAIYSTIGGPYKPGPWGVSTRKGNKIYLHILSKFSQNDKVEIVLPPLPVKINNFYSLNNKKIQVEQSKDKLKIVLNDYNPKIEDNIVVLELDVSSENISPIETTEKNNVVVYNKVMASSSLSNKYSADSFLDAAEMHYIEGKKFRTWWSPDKNDKAPWMIVDFKEPVRFNYIGMSEQIRNCSVCKFVLEYERDGSWSELYTGDQIGMDFSVKIPETTTTKIRLRILDVDGNHLPNIQKINVFNF